MRKLILASVLALGLASPAWSMDCAVNAPNLPTLESVAQMVDGLWVPPVTDAQTGQTTPGHIASQLKLADGTEWAWTHWGRWWKPTGATTTDSMGNTVPVQANDGTDWSLGRWNGDPSKMPFGQAGGTSSTDTTTGVTTITAGPVTMTCPPPAGFPVSY